MVIAREVKRVKKLIELLQGKKTYLLTAAVALISIYGMANGGEAVSEVQDLLIAGAIAALRGGVSKVGK